MSKPVACPPAGCPKEQRDLWAQLPGLGSLRTPVPACPKSQSGPPGEGTEKSREDVRWGCRCTASRAPVQGLGGGVLRELPAEPTETARHASRRRSPLKCQPEAAATSDRQNSSSAECLPPRRNVPSEAPQRWPCRMSHPGRTTSPSCTLSTKQKSAFGFGNGVAVTDGA